MNSEEKIVNLKAKIEETNQTILTLKSNIETISKLKKEKEKVKLEKKGKKN